SERSFRAEIEFVVSDGGGGEAELIEEPNHRPPFFEIRVDRTLEFVAGIEQDHPIPVLAFQATDLGGEVHGPAFFVFDRRIVPGFHLLRRERAVDIVRAEDHESLEVSRSLEKRGIFFFLKDRASGEKKKGESR